MRVAPVSAPEDGNEQDNEGEERETSMKWPFRAQSHSSTFIRRASSKSFTENFIRRASSKSFTEKETSIAATLAIARAERKSSRFYLTLVPFCTGIIVFLASSLSYFNGVPFAG
jgi:hypothetical protein